MAAPRTFGLVRWAPTLVAALVMTAPEVTAQTMAPAAPAALRGFGAAIVLRGDDLWVGRVGRVVGYGYPMPSSVTGSVHHFRRGSDGSWVEAAALKAPDAALADGFGASLAVSGGRLAAGAPFQAAGGAAYVFTRRGEEWVAEGRVALPDAAEGDGFGQVVAVQGDLLVVGAPGRREGRGAVYAARWANGAWSAPVLVAQGEGPGDRLGAAIALTGTTVLIGVPGGPPQPGKVLVYRAAAGAWTSAGQLDAPADSVAGFGASILATGDELFVAAPAALGGAGAVYAFRASGAGWAPAGRIEAPQRQPGAAFGAALARSGPTLMIGAPTARGGVGAVQVYTRAGEVWSPIQQLTVPPSGLAVLFGLAIGVDGGHAVVGGPAGELFEGTGHAYTRDAGTGQWQAAGEVADRSAGLPAITGAEARCESGTVADFPCQEMDLLSFLPVSQVGGERGVMVNDIWGWTDPDSRREFALLGRTNGTSFIEVTDPTNPRFLGDLPMTSGARANLWRDVKVYRNHAFVVADGAGPHGMQIFDLTRLLRVAGPPVTFTADAHYDRIASAHNIAINEATGFAYTIGNSAGGETCGGALHMIDIRDPLRPTFAGCFADPATGRARTGYTHDNQCVVYQGPDARFSGRELCFNASETAIGIADVTDKANPKAVASAQHPNTGYVHQGWLSADHRYFFVNDELDEVSGAAPRTRTLVYDVQRLDEPVLAKEFFGTTAASDHNLYVRGQYMFQSNYVAGLRVIDVSDPLNPRETGYFDTVPWGADVPGFQGSWSNYPYFPSGTIVVSSMREGFFVLRHRPARPLVP